MAELNPVIRTIIAEALGEGSQGMRMVGETVVNRSQQRGLTPEQVVQQAHQYTGWSDPGAAARRAFDGPEVVSAAQAAWELAQGPGDPTNGANHYFNPNIVQPTWARGMTPTTTYGNHAFYTDRDFTQRGAAAAPTPQTIGSIAIAQRNRVTPAVPLWAMLDMNQPPARTALSPAAQQAARLAALRLSQSYAGQERGPTSTGWAAAAAQGARQPSAFGVFEQGGRAPNQSSGNPINTAGYPVIPDRLTPDAGMFSGAFPVTQSASLAARRNGHFASIPNVGPVPANMSANINALRNGTGVATQLSTKRAPVPLTRPNFGIGGLDLVGYQNGAPLSLLGALQGPQSILAGILGSQARTPEPVAPRPEVGTLLGIAANGGQMMEGHGGVMNSITQASNAWRAATGDSSADGYRSGGDHDRNHSVTPMALPEGMTAPGIGELWTWEMQRQAMGNRGGK